MTMKWNLSSTLRGAFAAVFAMLLLARFDASAQTVPDQGPGGPILVINDSSSPNGKFYAEILRNEGFNAFAVASLSSVTSTMLNNYDVVVLARTSPTSTQITMLTNWVNAGGNLIAMRPASGLASLLGVTISGTAVQNGYVLVNTGATSPGYGIVGETIQYFGAADRYTLNGATEVARLYTTESAATTNSAVTIRNVGSSGGQAVAYSYDLATSLVQARQGNPAWAGQDRDGGEPIRSNDLYFGNSAVDPKPDWVNLNKAGIPQADEQQRLLANLIQFVNKDRKPLPRFWYFPRGEKAVVIMTGDDHAHNGTQGRFQQQIDNSPVGCSVANWECIRSTSYIYPGASMTSAQANSFAAQGFEIGLHVTTGCSDFTASTLEANYSAQIAQFTSQFPGVPAVTTMRHHCIVWSDWATAAKVQRAHGIRLDTTYYFYPPSWVLNRPGFMTGSAMPMRFADTDGTLIDVYQAATQMTDESGQQYPYTANSLLDAALGDLGYYGAFTANMHTDVATTPDSDEVMASAIARGVPIVSADQMLKWLDARNGSSFGSISRSGNTTNFTITKAAAANGLRGYIPYRNTTGTIQAITRGGTPVTFTTDVIKGVEYAFFDAQSGSHAVTYQTDTTAPTVGSVNPAANAANVSRFTNVSAVFSESVNPATVTSTTVQLRDGVGAIQNATVSYDAIAKRVTLQPTATLAQTALYTATIKGGASGVRDLFGNALAADYSWSFTTNGAADCPCGGWAPTDAPTTLPADDSSSVELGVKFTVDINGYVSGIRFYKGAGNTGVHTGTLWTQTGQELATAVFTAETASGWQQVNFDAPVAVTAGTVYVASYHAPNGHYSADANYFAGVGLDSGPVNLLQNGVAGPNGVFIYGPTRAFPTQTFAATNYWVDVAFSNVLVPDTTTPSVTAVTPTAGATSTSIGVVLNATFSEALNSATVSASTFQLRAGAGPTLAASVTYNPATRSATLVPSAPLATSTVYTATIKGGSTGVKDNASNPLATDFVWSFTTEAPDVTAPTITAVSPINGSTNVSRSVIAAATFSEAINAATVTTTNFELRGPGSALISASVAYDSTTRTASLTPIASLAPSTVYTATVRGGATGIKDTSGNALASNYTWSFTTGTTSVYTTWPNSTVPTGTVETDSAAVELGVKFTVDMAGVINGVRFYKSSGNTGTHVGNLWSSTGQLLASAPFTNETASGWQQVNFPTPVPVTVGTVYIASYHAPNGRYNLEPNFFTNTVDAGPINLLADGTSGGNGVYIYNTNSAFPTASWNASNYWVDAVFTTNIVDSLPPTITGRTPSNGASSVPTSSSISATFSEQMDPSTVTSATVFLRTASGVAVPAAVSYSGQTAVLAPTAALAAATTYTATVKGGLSGARDLAGNALSADSSWTFTTDSSQIFSAWDATATPAVLAEDDPSSVVLGVKFTVDVAGKVNGVRFYKGPGNGGTHVGSLWTAAGQQLATANFSNETASGWQQVTFPTAVSVVPGTVYIASYLAPLGRYSYNSGFFANSGVDAGPINLLQDGVSGGNGVYAYSSTNVVPTSTWGSSNYWVDVVFAAMADSTPPSISGVAPTANATNVSTAATPSVTFNEPVNSSTVTSANLELRTSGGVLVASTVSYNSATSTATLTPNAQLGTAQTYTATVRGGSTGIKDVAGNALASNYVWSFTTSASQTYSAWGSTTTPAVPAEDDSSSVNVGVKFTVDVNGAIGGIRFYKGAGNTGTHVGSLWTSTGQLLASATFANETATGWQQVSFGAPVAVTAGTVYVASYLAPNGHYAATGGYFTSSGVDAGPVNLLQDGASGGNGVFAYASSSAFPANSWQGTNYWVDVVFATSVVDTIPPTISGTAPASGGTSVSAAASLIARFSEAMSVATITSTNFQLLNSSGNVIPATVTYDSGSASAGLDPTPTLSFGTTYTAVVRGGASGVKDSAGNALVSDYTWTFTTETSAGSCTSAPNPIVAENCLPGNPPSEWDITGIGDPSIQGFATDISVNRGQTISFKVNTNATAYTIDIYRLGYYGGMGARKITTINPSAALPQTQPGCLSDPTTGLVDCGNWAVSASWAVPASATSGIYIARLKRTNNGGASHIVFIVRNDSSTSHMLFQTSDTTWQAYNTYGGNNFYTGSPAGRAYKLSYNRPFNTRIVADGQDWLFNAEYPMVRWLELNGYDVTYTTGVDSDRRGSLLLNHRVFLSVGHDEYWSGSQRTNVENARNGGVNLAFFSGNEVFWKTRWEPSIDGSSTPYRTLVSYKETHANGFIDPQSPPTWTGTWRDPRFSPPADGGRPENALTGTAFMVNAGTVAIQVPAADGRMRLWRNTSIATLPVGGIATLADSTLGYEWDSDLDNGHRPPGLIRLSTTVATDVEVLQDHGSTYATADATHHLTLYKHTSGARVFGAGTVQWSWGLDGNHDRGEGVPDVRMQQATVNLFADMNVQPVTLQPGLVSATASSDTVLPTSAFTSPASGATLQRNVQISISGTAADTGGGVVGGVEVSTDNGATWHPASGRGTWTYSWRPTSPGAVTLRVRAVDDSGNLQTATTSRSVTVN